MRKSCFSLVIFAIAQYENEKGFTFHFSPANFFFFFLPILCNSELPARLLLQLFSCESLIALTKKRNPKLKTCLKFIYKKCFGRKRNDWHSDTPKKCLEVFLHHPSIRFLIFSSSSSSYSDYRVMMNDVIDQPGRQSLICSSFILDFHNATYKYLLHIVRIDW